MKYKAIIFDLDGTLIDSLLDIVRAVNFALKECGNVKQYTYEEGKALIGDGAFKFAERAYSFKDYDEEEFSKFCRIFFDAFKRMQGDTTKPYEGVVEMLKNLKAKGYKLCIASNKPHELMKIILKIELPEIEFDQIEGQKPGYHEKPDPTIVNEIKNNLNLKDSDCLYVGDSYTDVKTAENANIDVCLVTYGYGKYTKELKEKATYVASSIQELSNLLL